VTFIIRSIWEGVHQETCRELHGRKMHALLNIFRNLTFKFVIKVFTIFVILQVSGTDPVKTIGMKGQFLNDHAALMEVSKGNLEAYRYLFDHHFRDICNFLLLYLHDREIAEEIALDIFTYVWEKRETLQIKSSFKGFLLAAAKNRAISAYRKEQKRLFTSLHPEDLRFPDPDSSHQVLEKQELHQLISQAIESLPPQSRIIYRMAWEENLSQKEIAQKLGLSPKTVENHVGIALRKLRDKLRPYYGQIFLLWITSTFFS